MKKQQGNVVTIIVIIAVVVALLGVLGFVLWQRLHAAQPAKTQDSSQATEEDDKKQAEKVAVKSYCLTYEKLCFDYPANWKLEDTTSAYNALNEFTKGDKLTLTSPDAKFQLMATTGISGIGGTCGADDNTQVTAYALDGIPVKGLTGFKTDYEQSTDQVYVAQVVTHDTASAPYVPYIYITNQKDYTVQDSIVGRTGLCFSNIIPGRHAEVPDSDPVTYGATSFGVNYTNLPSFMTLEEASAQFDTDTYQQAISVLASLHYK